MRVALTLLLTSSVAFAQASSPPSKTLERAIKLYDKQDFFSASIELQKVLAGETGDDATNKQRAEFFMGKTFYQMGFYAASAAYFDKIAQNQKQTYRQATLKWLVGLTKQIPREDLSALGAYQMSDGDDPSLASVKDEFLYDFGMGALDKDDFTNADKAFGAIASSSPFYARARYEQGVIALRKTDDKAALAAFSSVDAKSDAGELALLGIVAVDVRAQKWDDAITAAGKIGGPLKARGAWEAVLARAGKKKLALGKLDAYARTVDPLEPALLQVVGSCDDKSDALSKIRGDAKTVGDELDALLKKYDDNAEMYELYRRGFPGLSKPTEAVVKAMMTGPSMEHALGFVAELDRELTLLQKSDKAWQTTAVAADILAEVTVMQSVASADAGKRLVDRLTRVAAGIHAIASEKTKIPCS